MNALAIFTGPAESRTTREEPGLNRPKRMPVTSPPSGGFRNSGDHVTSDLSITTRYGLGSVNVRKFTFDVTSSTTRVLLGYTPTRTPVTWGAAEAVCTRQTMPARIARLPIMALILHILRTEKLFTQDIPQTDEYLQGKPYKQLVNISCTDAARGLSLLCERPRMKRRTPPIPARPPCIQRFLAVIFIGGRPAARNDRMAARFNRGIWNPRPGPEENRVKRTMNVLALAAILREKPHSAD